MFVQWLGAWVPCQDPATFEITAPSVFQDQDPIRLTHHSDVCEPVYTADGRCPRSVVSATTQHDRSNTLAIGR